MKKASKPGMIANIEDSAHADMQRIKEEESQQRPKECPRIVANALKPKRSTSVFYIH